MLFRSSLSPCRLLLVRSLFAPPRSRPLVQQLTFLLLLPPQWSTALTTLSIEQTLELRLGFATSTSPYRRALGLVDYLKARRRTLMYMASLNAAPKNAAAAPRPCCRARSGLLSLAVPSPPRASSFRSSSLTSSRAAADPPLSPPALFAVVDRPHDALDLCRPSSSDSGSPPRLRRTVAPSASSTTSKHVDAPSSTWRPSTPPKKTIRGSDASTESSGSLAFSRSFSSCSPSPL